MAWEALATTMTRLLKAGVEERRRRGLRRWKR